jgi:hypothetical protein
MEKTKSSGDQVREIRPCPYVLFITLLIQDGEKKKRKRRESDRRGPAKRHIMDI